MARRIEDFLRQAQYSYKTRIKRPRKKPTFYQIQVL